MRPSLSKSLLLVWTLNSSHHQHGVVATSTCTQLRVPPINVVFELVHVDSFEQLHHQAHQVCTAHHLPSYKCDGIKKQFRATLEDMVTYGATEALVNITIDHRLAYEVNARPNLSASDKRVLDDLVLLPEQPVDKTIDAFCERFVLDTVACQELQTGILPFVARDWGCMDAPAQDQVTVSFPTATTAAVDANSIRLEVAVEGQMHFLNLVAGDNINVTAVRACWEWNVSVTECPKLLAHVHAKTATIAAFQAASTVSLSNLITITSPRAQAYLPVSQRVYFDLAWHHNSSDPVCLYMDFHYSPVYCGVIHVPDQLYARFQAPGDHVLLITRSESRPSSLVLAFQYFTVVQPTIQLLNLSTAVVQDHVFLSLEVHTTAFDPHDTHHRLCARFDTAFDCFLPSKIVIESNDSGLILRVPLFGVTNGSHTLLLMLVNEYNKVFASLPAPIEFTMTLDPTSIALARDASYFYQPTPPPLSRECDLVVPSAYHWICSLWQFEYGLYSQNGEDGVLQAIFDHIGTTTRSYVEFGTEDATECNTRYLRQMDDWTGLLMDGRHENTTINLHQEWITPSNINELLSQHDVPTAFDLLSIDVDFNDYWILASLNLDQFSPRVIVVEYNAHVNPKLPIAVAYQDQGWDGKSRYFGASVGAFHHWGLTHGYTLVYCESHGVNCFFIRDDVLNHTVPLSSVLRPELVYQRPNYFGRGITYPSQEKEEVWIRIDGVEIETNEKYYVV